MGNGKQPGGEGSAGFVAILGTNDGDSDLLKYLFGFDGTIGKSQQVAMQFFAVTKIEHLKCLVIASPISSHAVFVREMVSFCIWCFRRADLLVPRQLHLQKGKHIDDSPVVWHGWGGEHGTPIPR